MTAASKEVSAESPRAPPARKSHAALHCRQLQLNNNRCTPLIAS